MLCTPGDRVQHPSPASRYSSAGIAKRKNQPILDMALRPLPGVPTGLRPVDLLWTTTGSREDEFLIRCAGFLAQSSPARGLALVRRQMQFSNEDDGRSQGYVRDRHNQTMVCFSPSFAKFRSGITDIEYKTRILAGSGRAIVRDIPGSSSQRPVSFMRTSVVPTECHM